MGDSHEQKYTHWNHLKPSEVFLFAVSDIGDKFEITAKTIVPYPNIADSPLNKYVTAQMITEDIKSALLEDTSMDLDAPVNFKNNFLAAFITRLNSFLEKALEERL